MKPGTLALESFHKARHTNTHQLQSKTNEGERAMAKAEPKEKRFL